MYHPQLILTNREVLVIKSESNSYIPSIFGPVVHLRFVLLMQMKGWVGVPGGTGLCVRSTVVIVCSCSSACTFSLSAIHEPMVLS